MKTPNFCITGTSKKVKNKLIIFFFIGLGILSLGIRVWWGSVDELNQAELSLKQGDFPSAVIHYEKTILWNFPFFNYKGKAMKGINSIKQKAQNEKNQVVSRYAEDALTFAQSSIGISPTNRPHLNKTPPPPRFWSAMVGLSLLTWIGIVFFLIGFSFDNHMDIRSKRGFIFTLSLFVLVFFFWIYSILSL